MVRPTYNLDSYRDLIIDLYQRDVTTAKISETLRDMHNFKVTSRTIENRLKEWQQSKRTCTIDTAILRLRIHVLFSQYLMKDNEMLEVLHAEGHKLGLRALAKLRKNEGLVRRGTSYTTAEADAELRAIVAEELAKGEISSYRRENL